MSRTVPRPSITFRSARRVTIEAPETHSSRAMAGSRCIAKEGNWRTSENETKSEKYQGKDGATSEPRETVSLNNSNNINNNNADLPKEKLSDKVNSIEVIKTTRKEGDSNLWSPSNSASDRCGLSKNNFIVCGKAENTSTVTSSATTTTAPLTSTASRFSEQQQQQKGDSSNNNSTRIGSTCLVDNLVMESGQHLHDEGKTDDMAKDNAASTEPRKAQEANKIEPPQEVTFGDPRQSQVFQMLTGVQSLRRDLTFADITIKIKDTEFKCHRFVLALNSPYLLNIINQSQYSLETPSTELKSNIKDECDGAKALTECESKQLFDNGGNENEKSSSKDENGKATSTEPKDCDKATQERAENCIVLTGIEPETFSNILDFMYCQFEGVMTTSNCIELLLAADTLQLPHLRRTCATFVSETLSPCNVFQVLVLYEAGYAGLFEPNIMKRAHQVIRENFVHLSSMDQFLGLGRHVMIPLIADSMLHIRSEMEVLQVLLKWVKCRPEERCSDMTLMLQHVRFPLMSSRELEKLREVPLLAQNSLAMALIEESRAYGNLDYHERMAWPRHNSVSRCLFSTRDLILWTADRDKGLHFYSIIDGQHHKVTSFGQLTSGNASTSVTSSTSGSHSATGNFSFDSTSSVCCYGDKIFFTGGEFNTDMVWSVDTSTGEVKVHAKMPRGRKFHSMVASKGCVYCLGGQDKRGYTVLEDVDAYIINKDMWVKVGHLAVPAYNMSAAISGGAIYLVGGLDHAGQPLRLIQCFIALRSGLYSAFKVEISNMPPSLLSARAVACGLDKSIYIVCGHGEVYQFEADRQSLNHVTTLRNLSDNPRVRFGLAFVGGCLVVIGGHQLGHVMHEPIRSVCLDIASKTEVRDYSPLLPGDIVNTCLAAKLSSNILRLFNE